jgi:hypothetical protein
MFYSDRFAARYALAMSSVLYLWASSPKRRLRPLLTVRRVTQTPAAL